MTTIPQATEADLAPAAVPQGPPQIAIARSLQATGISYRSLLLFYLPLGFSGLMMTLDLPVVTGVLNRFPNPNTSVAALSVAFSLALVYEASHISMIDASTALSTDLHVFRMLQRFYAVMSAALLVVASAIAFSPLYDIIVRGLMKQSPDVAEAARPAVWAFLLWPIPIGWRRLCQGALIKHGHPKPVGAGGIVRLASLLLSLLFFAWLSTNIVHIEPAAIGVLSMLLSVTAESAAVQGWTARILKTIPASTPGIAPTYGDIWRFVLPLSGTSIMSTLVQPTLRAGIAAAAIAWATTTIHAGAEAAGTVAVASYQTAWSMAFLVFGPTLSMTQASIAWNSSHNRETRQRGSRLLVILGLGLAALMALASLTPFIGWLFANIIQAPPQTAAMAVDVTRWLIPMPILHSISFMLRGKQIAARNPKAVRRAQLIDLAAIALIIWLAASGPLLPLFHGAPAAPLAAAAYDLMLCVDITVLWWSLRRRIW
ncbi:MAG: hypothetical protein M3014_05150 [Chloroflexota bacterium]|nr:hypothetical protein [Chloroflexota bacterium]